MPDSPPIADYVTVRPLVGHSYEIYLGEQRLGYVGLAQPGGRSGISWLPIEVGGVSMTIEERIAVVHRIRELMAQEWDKHTAAQRRLREAEDGLAAAEAGQPAPVAPSAPAPSEGPVEA